MKSLKFALTDVIWNVPHIVLFFIYASMANGIKKRKTYVLVSLFLISAIVFLNDMNVISAQVRVGTVFLVMTFFVLLFVDGGRSRALVYNIAAYIIAGFCELLGIVVGYLIFGNAYVEVFTLGGYATVILKLLAESIYAFIGYVFCGFWRRRYRNISGSVRPDIMLAVAVAGVPFFGNLGILVRTDFSTRVAIPIVVYIFCYIALMIISFSLFAQQDKRRRAELTAYYLDQLSGKQRIRERELSEDIDKAKKLREHSLKSIKRAQELLVRRRSADARQCIDELLDEFSAKYRYSNHKVADVVLSEKAKLCEKERIAFSCSFALPDNLSIDGAALCVILSNLLDNAIRACTGEGKGGQACISITAKLQAGYLVIAQENSFYGEPERRRQGVFSRHGLGLEIVESIAKRYDGQLTAEQDKETGRFITRLFMRSSQDWAESASSKQVFFY